MRILLIEDFGDLASGITSALAGNDHRVSTAVTAAEAEAAFEREPFDLLIMDLRLPDGDGWSLMRRLSGRHSVPAIAVSGLASPDDVARSREVGFRMHLPKPLDLDVLLSCVAALDPERVAHRIDSSRN